MLNIYLEHAPHGGAKIIGDYASLIDLQNAITKAISSKESVLLKFFDSDGEQYELDISCVENSVLMKRPYYDWSENASKVT